MSKELKSIAYAETNKLRDHVVLNENNSFNDVPNTLYEELVLKECEITPEQLKKKEKLDDAFTSGMLYVAGEQVGDRFKADKELTEVGFKFNLGGSTNASAIFTRNEKTVVKVEHKVATAEMKRVLTHLDGLFETVSG